MIHYEEVFWRQWSRSLWLPAGDKNTSFFHQKACQKKKKNTIEGLYDENGVWQIDEGRVSAIAERYYVDLFKAQSHTNMDRMLEDVDRVVTNEMVQFLNQPYSKEDVRRALFSMHPSKSLGLDGMSPFFLQKFWHIVGPDVTMAVLSVLHSGKYLRKMNFTHIVLITKKNDP